MPEGFLERWSRRKRQTQAGPAQPAPSSPAPEPPPPAPPKSPKPPKEAPPAVPPAPVQDPPPAPEPPPPTLEEARALTPESDFRPFMAKNVAPEVKKLAFKKLFADPHFNVMDGLDTYIDDYSKPAPLPESSLRKMASAAFLKLFDEETEETPRQSSAPDVAQSMQPGETPSPQAPPPQEGGPASQNTDDHADLRLQPDDAAGAQDPRRRAG